MMTLKISGRAAAASLVAVMAVLTGPALAASANSQDETWLVAAHQSNLAEIAAGKDAQQNASNSDVKDLGAMLVADHTKLDTTIKALASKYQVDLPSQPTAAQKAALAKAKSSSGAGYDAVWVQTQTTGHLQTKAATKKELSGGSESDVLAAAKTATPVIQHHIDELRSIASDLGINVPSSVSAGSGGQAAAGTSSALPLSLTVAGLMLLAGAAVMFRRRRGSAPA